MEARGHGGIIFDLDGTLWDSTEAIAFAWNSALAELGSPLTRARIVTARDIAGVCGLPFLDCVRTALPELNGSSDFSRFAEILDKTEQRLVSTRGGKLYPGVEENIPRLARLHPLYIVSNCQAWYLDTFLRVSGLAEYFKDADCFGKSGKDKKETIAAMVARNSIARPLYIGDTARDLASARAAGSDFAFAAYGFGILTPEERKLCVGHFENFQEITAHLLTGGALLQ